MNSQVLIQNLKTALTSYYVSKYADERKRKAKIELLRSIRNFIVLYQKNNGIDYNGDMLNLSRPLTETYGYSSQIIHGNAVMFAELKAKSIKKDLEKLSRYHLGNDLYEEIEQKVKNKAYNIVY